MARVLISSRKTCFALSRSHAFFLSNSNRGEHRLELKSTHTGSLLAKRTVLLTAFFGCGVLNREGKEEGGGEGTRRRLDELEFRSKIRSTSGPTSKLRRSAQLSSVQLSSAHGEKGYFNNSFVSCECV